MCEFVKADFESFFERIERGITAESNPDSCDGVVNGVSRANEFGTKILSLDFLIDHLGYRIGGHLDIDRCDVVVAKEDILCSQRNAYAQ